MNAIEVTVGAVVIPLATAIWFRRSAASRRRRRRIATKTGRVASSTNRPRRQHHLEHQMAESAFSTLRNYYGEIFREFSITRRFNVFTMDVATKNGWKALDGITRSLIARFLWRTLDRLAKGVVELVIDRGGADRVVWTVESDRSFKDYGLREPWAAPGGRVGTLLSGRD